MVDNFNDMIESDYKDSWLPDESRYEEVNYHESLPNIELKIWSVLNNAVINRKSSFRLPVFICGSQDDFDGRIVVLRKSDKTKRLLQFHSDIRSGKVQKLKKNKKAAMVFYDKDQKIQLRMKVECTVNFNNDITHESWLKTQHVSRKCYLVDNAPGSTSPIATSGLKKELEDFKFSKEKSEEGYKNFAVTQCNIKSIEWLYLSAKGHRRCFIDYSGGKKYTWLTP